MLGIQPLKQPCSLLLSLPADDLLYHSHPLVFRCCLCPVWVWRPAAWRKCSHLERRASAEPRHVTRRQAPLWILSFLCPQLRVSGHVQSVRPSIQEMLAPCPAACLVDWPAPGLAKLTIHRPALCILSPPVTARFRVFFLHVYPRSLPLIV